jgi:DNA-directed RNA polymerase subunit omega
MNIISLPIEFDKNKIDSRFRLVTIATQRAKELAYGAAPKVSSKFKKIPTIALEESLESKLEFLTGEEAIVANEEAKKFDFKRFIQERKKEAMPEDISDLEKDLKVYLTEREETGKQALEELFAESNEDKSGQSEG